MQRQKMIDELSTIVGKEHVLTKSSNTKEYRKGFRYGDGKVLAVVQPGTLVELWKVTKACVNAGIIIIPQASNTGITGGSTPYGEYDRDIVIINNMRIKGIHLINNAQEIIAMPGSRLFELEKLLKPHKREPHSVIGSSSIGASIIGGVCNNSGGALINRGPAYTQMALYGQVTDDGDLKLVNHLGIELGEDPETILSRLESKDYTKEDILPQGDKICSDHTYSQRLRQLDIEKPARFNNDPDRLYEVSGSAGKLMVFAVRLDTYPKAEREQVFYMGSNDPRVLSDLRTYILTNFKNLPVMGEYIHRGYFNLGERYGRDTFLVIDKLGTKYVPTFFDLKNRFDRKFNTLSFMPNNLSDKIMQFLTDLLPSHLPKVFREYRDKYEHHLIIKVTDDSIEETHEFLKEFFNEHSGSFHVCTAKEGKAALLHRFAAAGASRRYTAVKGKELGSLISLDIALKRNEKNWFESLPSEIESQIIEKLYCGHFFCNVMHHDYILKPGTDEHEVKEKLKQYTASRGAEFPAEHNVGHIYKAKKPLADFYRSLDPTNTFNPGIGQTSKLKNWASEETQKTNASAAA